LLTKGAGNDEIRIFGDAELAAAPEQEESSHEREDPDNYSEGHSGKENGIANVSFGVRGEVVEQMSECEGSEEDGHAGDDVQNSHGNASLT
jgi:hypothetical protein